MQLLVMMCFTESLIIINSGLIVLGKDDHSNWVQRHYFHWILLLFLVSHIFIHDQYAVLLTLRYDMPIMNIYPYRKWWCNSPWMHIPTRIEVHYHWLGSHNMQIIADQVFWHATGFNGCLSGFLETFEL